MPQEIQQLQQEINDLKGIVYQLIRGDRYLFQKDLDIFDHNIVLHSRLGTRIGTASTQKLGFLGATPISRQSAITAPSGGGTGSTDAIDVSGRTAINALIAIVKNYGFTA